MPCPRCGAIGVDAQGLCLRCRLFVGAPAGPPPVQRNPLLIPGIVFAVVAVLLIGAVVVYAATGGDDPAGDTVAERPVTTAAADGSPTLSVTPSPSPTAGPGAGPSAGPSVTASPSGDTCIQGVWLEERHDENVTILNTGVRPFTGNGTFHRYNDSGRVILDYGSGVRLSGANGANTYEFVYTGIIVYSYRVENGQVIYSNPRPDGTETLFRNGKQDYSIKLAAHNIPPMTINCGSVAMRLTGTDMTLELRRTSAPK